MEGEAGRVEFSDVFGHLLLRTLFLQFGPPTDTHHGPGPGPPRTPHTPLGHRRPAHGCDEAHSAAPLYVREVCRIWRTAYDSLCWVMPRRLTTAADTQHALITLPSTFRWKLLVKGNTIEWLVPLLLLRKPPCLDEAVLIDSAAANVDALAGVRAVSLFNCRSLHDLSGLAHGCGVVTLRCCPRVGDLVPLQGVPEVDVRVCVGVADISALSAAHSVTLATCRAVCDVSPLRNVHTVVLDDLPRVSDVSPLRRARVLELTHCPAVHDVAALGRVHTLTLARCPITDVSALAGVTRLTLTGLPVVDVSALSRVHTLVLEECEQVADVAALATVHKLVLDSCPLVCDLSGLGRSSLAHEHAYDDDAQARQSPAVRAEGGGGAVADKSGRSQTERHGGRSLWCLKLRDCGGVRDVSALGSVAKLSIDGCPVTDVGALGTVHTLSLARLDVADVSALGSVHSLTLSNCARVGDVSALGRVRCLTLHNCPAVRGSLAMLASVHRLTVTNCPLT